MYSYNTFYSLNLNWFDPNELVFGREPRVLIDLETDPNVKVSGTYKECYKLMHKMLKYLQKSLFNF